MSLAVDLRSLNLDDGLFGLRVASEDQETISFFNQQGLLGDGCTWGAIVDALLRATMPDKLHKLELNCEAESLLLMSDDQALLQEIGVLLHNTAQNEEAILQAIADADPDMLE